MIRGVGGVPAGVLEQVALDYGGQQGGVEPAADERFEDAVFGSQLG